MNDQSSPRVLEKARRFPFLSVLFRRLNERQEEIVSLLRHTPIFLELSSAELIEVLHLLHERTFLPGEIIFSESEPGLALYVVFKGRVEVRRSVKKEQVALLGPGEVFGEVSFLDGSPRSATVMAKEKTELIGFYRMELVDLLEQKPVLAAKILSALARQMAIRMRAMLQQFEL